MPKGQWQTKRPEAPINRLCKAGGITRMELAARAHIGIESINRVAHGNPWKMPLESIAKLALALGCAPVELLPELGKRPRKGLLWERGVLGRGKGRDRLGRRLPDDSSVDTSQPIG